MKLSENWLREWVNPPIDTNTLLDQLTMAGLEVKSSQSVHPGFQRVMVGEVIALEPHPDAESLNVCQVDTGDSRLQIICGAENVRQGLKVAVAEEAADLPQLTIKKIQIRGIESQGMLCSAAELNLAEVSDGILELPESAPPGLSLSDYLKLDDRTIEIDLTPNRGDCLSVLGVARELAAINQLEINTPSKASVSAVLSDHLPIALQTPIACPRYLGRIIRGIDPNAEVPLWMQEKLRRSDIRSIHPAVAITNFVMMELGQPMHCFDLEMLNGGIEVRLANPGEKITLLDQSEVELNDDTLVIADHQKALALAGIMGGLESSVQAGTTDIFFEAAFFNPLEMSGKARRYSMHTDSSHRFERGVDPELPRQAIERATELLLEIAGGQAGPVLDASDTAYLPTSSQIVLRFDRISRLLGVQTTHEAVEGILKRLGMRVEDNQTGWLVTPPSFRFDINLEADLIEEIGRMIGYNHILGTCETTSIRLGHRSGTQVNLNLIRGTLVAQGFYEAITYAFVSPQIQAVLDPKQDTLALVNPISSDMSVMRTRMLPGLVQALQHNLNRQQSRLRLFESGLCFIPNGSELEQRQHIAAVITGGQGPEGLYQSTTAVDFFDIKGSLESILKLSQTRGLTDYQFKKSENPILHPGQSADILAGKTVIGFVGALHPLVLTALQLDQPVFVFEVDYNAISKVSGVPRFTELSRYPFIRRDISVSVDAETEVQRLIDCIKSVKSTILQEVFIFDVYTQGDMTNSRKSVSFGLILQDFSRTLGDAEVERFIAQVLQQLNNKHQAVLRGSSCH